MPEKQPMIDPLVNSYKPISDTPGPWRKLLGWIERTTGLDLSNGPPRFQKGLRVGGTFLSEDTLKALVDLVESPAKKKP
jgi:hypothetical protein